MSSSIVPHKGTEIILSGNEETLKPIITMCMALAQFFNDRDIGQFVGAPLEDNVRAHPHSLRMKLIWYSKKTPPYTNSMGIRMIKAEYQIPDVDHKSVDWNILKQAMGGSDGYMWGRFVATVKLDNGRQMQCYGATAKEAENQIHRMIPLTTAKVLSLGITELKKEGRRKPGQTLYIEPTRVYPAYMVLVNSKQISKIEQRMLTEESSTRVRSKLRGDYRERGTERIKMFSDFAPHDFKAQVRAALNFNANG